MQRHRRLVMTRWIAVLVALVGLAGTSQAYAQEATAGPGTLEVSIIPGGGVFFTENTDANEPSFGNYDLGGAVAFNFNRYVGVEGEIGGALGVSQDLQFGGFGSDRKTPNILNYSGNLVISAANRSAVVPYVTGGIGGRRPVEEGDLGDHGTQTILADDGGC